MAPVRGWHHHAEWQYLGDLIAETHAFDAGISQNNPIQTLLTQLSKACVHVSSQGNNLEFSVQSENLRLSPQAPGSYFPARTHVG